MKILIVDDEPAIADTLAYALSTEGFSCQCCTLGKEALALVVKQNSNQNSLENSAPETEQAFTLMILDVGLPDMSGFDVCRVLRQSSQIPVIFLTARAEEVDRIVGLELGADDYVTKPFSPREVVSRVRAILRRTQPAQSETQPTQPLVKSKTPAKTPAPPPPTKATLSTAQNADFHLDLEGMRIAYADVWLDLTRYEYLLLAYLLERPGRVLSRSAIMDQVWANAIDSDERTVDTHIKTLRAKLRRIRPTKDPIITLRGLGYRIQT